MDAMPGACGFSVTTPRSGASISCDADGFFVGDVPLLRRTGVWNASWSIRPLAEVNEELTARYRLPVDVCAKAGSLALIAAALNRGDLMMAAVAAVQMQFPDPPPLGEDVEAYEEIAQRAAKLQQSGLLKFWDPAKHPRTGTPPNPGWFAPESEEGDAATVEPVVMLWPPWQKPEIVEGGGGGGAPRGQLEFPSIRWPWSRAPSSEASGAAPKPSPPVDAQPDLPFPEGLPRQRAPAADADVSGEDSPTQVPASGGRLGNAATRAQNAEIAAELKDRGYTITGGGGEEEEEFIQGEGPGNKGGTFVDITAVDETTGKTVRVQTVDTLADGITPAPREQAAIARIRNKYPDDELWIIPKRKMP